MAALLEMKFAALVVRGFVVRYKIRSAYKP
jgi:hypothetical protein